jgi:hypothetical protein
MNRAVFFVALAAAGSVACSSSGNSPGPTVRQSEQGQGAPTDPNDALLNPDLPPPNQDQPPVAPDQPPPNPDQPPSSSSGGGFDSCPALCTGVATQCVERCATTCLVYNVLYAACPAEIAAIVACAGGVLTCNDNGRLKLLDGSCTEELSAAGPCFERVSQSNSSTTRIVPTPIPTQGSAGSDGGP